MTSRNVFFSAAMTLAIVLSFSACGLQTGGLGGGLGGGGGAPIPCANDGHCDDGNPCTTERCDTESGVCLTPSALDDGPLAVELQKAGDCKTLFCKAGEPVAETDDKDFLVDDNDCTVDQCAAGKPVQAVQPDGSACSINGAKGSCKTSECVVECGAGKPACDDMEPCTTDACDAELGKCTFIALVEGTVTPGTDDALGNCKIDVCIAGKAKVLDDDSDTPSASGDCQEGKCDMGTPSATLFPINTPCKTNGGALCDGAGSCVECNDDGQCGPTNECQQSVCTDHACVITFTPLNTPVMMQQPGDCKINVCDGGGKIVIANDDMDTQGDGNSCTDDICTGGVLSHPPSMINTVCGVGLVCNGVGGCVGCTMNGQCNAPETCGGCGVAGECCCKPKTCADLGLKCGSAPDGCGGMVVCNDGKNNGETDVDCGGPNCSVKCALAKTCAAGSDCSSGFCADGVCCDGACNSACQACNLGGKVGQCSPVIGAPDNNPANSCSGTSSCDATGSCKKINGQACGVAGDCVSGFCADGVCCDGLCSGTCQACNLAGKLGQCSNIAGGSPDNNATVQCNGNNTCDGNGNCKKIDGQVCAGSGECFHPNCVDGVCCNNGCGTTCQACNIAGSVGTCSNIPSGQTDTFPANACSGNNACNGGNGAGACKKILAQPCAGNAECLSTTCADGVCCNGACNAACRSCNVAGSVGTCINLTSGTDNVPANICVAPNTCDAMGNCKKVNGQGCGGNAECASGTCLDGFCCGSASCADCQACTGPNGTCVNLGLGVQDNVPANTCTGNNACDGMGACKLKNGQVCAAEAVCASGICADGVCCNNACALTCQACNIVNSIGTCTNITSGTDADTCTGTSTCNASSQCKKNNGQGCAAGADCLSGNCTDGTCCSSASCGTCQSCALNGSGTCSFIASGFPDTNSAPVCDVTSTCNGAGACKKLDGQVCGAPAECFSGNCVDGVCCNVACMGTCMACNVGGSVGMCTNLGLGATDATATVTCSGTNACDGMGACKLRNGQSCAGGVATCASGKCADAICCDTECAGLCQACTSFKKGGGADGTCAPIANNSDPDNECIPTKCDGAGMCLP
jgi:hypothetical protein